MSRRPLRPRASLRARVRDRRAAGAGRRRLLPGEERAREIGDEIWHERLAEAWPDRRDVDLDPAHKPFRLAEFTRSVRSLLSSPYLFVGSPDYSAPVNTGLWLLRPRRWLHRHCLRLFVALRHLST